MRTQYKSIIIQLNSMGMGATVAENYHDDELYSFDIISALCASNVCFVLYTRVCISCMVQNIITSILFYCNTFILLYFFFFCFSIYCMGHFPCSIDWYLFIFFFLLSPPQWNSYQRSLLFNFIILYNIFYDYCCCSFNYMSLWWCAASMFFFSCSYLILLIFCQIFLNFFKLTRENTWNTCWF